MLHSVGHYVTTIPQLSLWVVSIELVHCVTDTLCIATCVGVHANAHVAVWSPLEIVLSTGGVQWRLYDVACTGAQGIRRMYPSNAGCLNCKIVRCGRD